MKILRIDSGDIKVSSAWKLRWAWLVLAGIELEREALRPDIVTWNENELLCGCHIRPSRTITWRSLCNGELKTDSLQHCCDRWGQPGGVGEGLALHGDRCLNGFCRWFYASLRWAPWQHSPQLFLFNPSWRWPCVSTGSSHAVTCLTLPVFSVCAKHIFVTFLIISLQQVIFLLFKFLEADIKMRCLWSLLWISHQNARIRLRYLLLFDVM